MIDHKPLENVEYLNYLGSMTTNYKICTRETKSRTAMACHNTKTVFTSKLDLVKCYICSITLYGAESWDTSENRSETPGKL